MNHFDLPVIDFIENALKIRHIHQFGMINIDEDGN